MSKFVNKYWVHISLVFLAVLSIIFLTSIILLNYNVIGLGTLAGISALVSAGGFGVALSMLALNGRY